ncbi:MAG TPA: glycosyltransferase family 39 protein [Isosphaeraceae bacterium]|nr:glycosyltransferase family 39 protein [Isosphaeraceae bacterium]
MHAPREGALNPRKERLGLVCLLALAFVVRAWKADQPIVENYVGRQIPTAMVARNLDRHGSFLYPELDTGPFPSYFLVEPPVYELSVVALKRATGVPLEPAGRLLSALGMVLAAWGLYGLVRSREGGRVALAALAAFTLFPVTIRYGRSFQADALMLGCCLSGLRCLQARVQGAGFGVFALGWLLLATGLALKVTSAYLLLPLVAAILPWRPRNLIWAGLALLPAALWYAHAGRVLAHAGGSAAQAETLATWLEALRPSAWLKGATYVLAARFLTVRAFTPLGFALAAIGFFRMPRIDRLWWIWGASALSALAVLVGKLHHEYYWLALAPLAAAGAGRAFVMLAEAPGRWGLPMAGTALIGLVACAGWQSASTWRNPPEWAHLSAAAAEVQRCVPKGDLVIAPEALLYYADRRGFRLELDPNAARRAAREWGPNAESDLTEVCRHWKISNDQEAVGLVLLDLEKAKTVYGSRCTFADVTGPFAGPRRTRLHQKLRDPALPMGQTLADRAGVVLIVGPGPAESDEAESWRVSDQRRASAHVER